MRKLLAVTSIMLMVGGIAAATSAKSPWIHVKVVEDRADGARVNINVPLSLVQVAIDVIDEESMIPGRIEINSSEVSVADLKRMWKELRSSRDGEIVEIEQDGEHVQIFRRDDTLHVVVRQIASAKTTVNIELPVTMVDALFEGAGPSLNLRGALARLDESFRGDLVRVEDGDTTVRVWVD